MSTEETLVLIKSGVIEKALAQIDYHIRCVPNGTVNGGRLIGNLTEIKNILTGKPL